MSKKSRRYKEESKPLKRKETTPKKMSTQLCHHTLQWLKKWFLDAWKAIVSASVVLTIIVAWLSLSPSITVVPTRTLDLKDPLATPFVITNESMLPIHSVEILCGINEIRFAAMHSSVKSLSLGYVKPPIRILHHKEQSTFLCPPAITYETPLDFGDITIDVSYCPSFIFWRRRYSARFVTEKDVTGIVHWYPKPLQD